MVITIDGGHMPEALTRYRDTGYPLATLVAEIKRGAIALPDLQRPFVWKNVQIRNLFDSIYRGFPIGQVMFWETGADRSARRINEGATRAPPRLLIIDGQQRLTGVFAVLTGTPVIDERYRKRHIRLAFRPRDGQFQVPTAATDRDPEYLSDITELFSPTASTRRTVNAFLTELARTRQVEAIPEPEADRLASAIDRLAALGQFTLDAVELDADLDEEEVADVFVRINSEGTRLEQADFLLTLMSVWWDEGRRQLETFAEAATKPPTSPGERSPFNHHLAPAPDQLLRVAVATAFRRGRLKSVYQILRGRDPDTGERSTELREQNFSRLADAQARVVDLHNWHEYLRSVNAAGFRSAKQIISQFALVAGYSIWLVGRLRGVPSRPLQNVTARWFYMSQATGRYSSSPETKLDRDLRLVDETNGPEGFVAALESALSLEMSEDYFTGRVPAELDARSWRNRPLAAYEASLVILEAPVLFSPSGETVSSRLDPAVVAVRGVERHHLFPKGWVRRTYNVSGHALNALADRPANASWVDWIENTQISDKPPSEYFERHARRLSEDDLAKHMRWHALPEGWHLMEYETFLEKRRVLMADVVRQGYERLRSRMSA
jgi:hypothetical protein